MNVKFQHTIVEKRLYRVKEPESSERIDRVGGGLGRLELNHNGRDDRQYYMQIAKRKWSPIYYATANKMECSLAKCSAWSLKVR